MVNAGYFMNTQTVALTVFGISAGLAMRFLHRYKVSALLLLTKNYSSLNDGQYLLVAGLSIRLLYALALVCIFQLTDPLFLPSVVWAS